jgi:AraC-like DNA-binding protein
MNRLIVLRKNQSCQFPKDQQPGQQHSATLACPKESAAPSAAIRASLDSHIEGRCTFNEIGLDLEIHANDSVERSTDHARFTVSPKLTVALILEGDLDAAVNNHALVMTARDGPKGYLWVNTREANLDRWIRSGQRVRKVTISLALEKCHNIFDMEALYRSIGLTEQNPDMALVPWQPTPQSLRHAEEILHLDQQGANLDRLESIVAALSIVRQAFSFCEGEQKPAYSMQPNTRDSKRARLAREFILSNINQPLNIEVVSKNSGMSISTLQRIFKNCFGCTVMEFIRIRRLELARLALLDEGITVGQAACIAGYSNTANFSTAFQREFGYSPSSCIRN